MLSNLSKQDFEKQFKDEIEINRLETLITGGVFVSDKEVRDSYLQQGTKVKFQYAVLSSEDVRKQINPTDAELQTFFKQNAARYKEAVPETREDCLHRVHAGPAAGRTAADFRC